MFVLFFNFSWNLPLPHSWNWYYEEVSLVLAVLDDCQLVSVDSFQLIHEKGMYSSLTNSNFYLAIRSHLDRYNRPSLSLPSPHLSLSFLGFSVSSRPHNTLYPLSSYFCPIFLRFFFFLFLPIYFINLLELCICVSKVESLRSNAAAHQQQLSEMEDRHRVRSVCML